MFRLGAISDELSPNTVRALDLAQSLGLREVEIHTTWSANIEQLSDKQVDRLNLSLAERGLSVCCVSSTVFLRCHLDDRQEAIPELSDFRSIEGLYANHLRALERSLVVANKLDAPFVRVFGFWQGGVTTEDSFQQAAEKFTFPLKMAQANGVPLVLENCPHTYFDWGARAAQLVALINSPWLRLLWDPCTGLRSREPDYLGALDAIRPYLAHVHAKDIVIDAGLKRGRAYVPVGEGEVRWKEIMIRLVRAGYDGVLSLEPHHVGADGTRESAAVASFNGLRRIYDRVVLRSTFA